MEYENPPNPNPSLGLQAFTEFLGTFLLVAVVLTKGRALAIGIMLIAIIYFGTNYSKCSYNPAVSAGLFGRGDINGKELTVYIIAEILGGIAAWHWYNLSQQKQTTTEKITHNSGIAGTENSR